MRTGQVSRWMHCIFKSVFMKNVYADGKNTGIAENVVITCYSADGEFKILLEPSEELLKRIQEEFTFGDPIILDEIFEIQDIAFVLYKDDITCKVLAKLKEGDLWP